jgi:hypothetical protein
MQKQVYVTGSQRRDLLIFFLVAGLILLTSFRLRVYFRAPPAEMRPPRSTLNDARSRQRQQGHP